MSRNLLIITQSVDEQKGVLEFFVEWIRELAKHFNHIDVITLSQGHFNLPENVKVYSLGKDSGVQKPLRWVRVVFLLSKLVHKSDTVFAHMSPIFAIVAWPFTFIGGKRLVLWYLHRSVTTKLKISTMLSDVVVTADADSLMFKNKKIIAIGHGINIDKFKIDRTGEFNHNLKIINVSRITPIKNLDVLIEALGILRDRGLMVEVDIVGTPMMKSDFIYFEKLKDLVTRIDINSRINFIGYVPNNLLVKYFHKSDMSVGLTPKGGIDKVIIEAMASGCITLTSNDVMEKYLNDESEDLIFKYRDSNDLANKLQHIMQLSSARRKNIIDQLYKSAKDNFAVEPFINKLSSILYNNQPTS